MVSQSFKNNAEEIVLQPQGRLDSHGGSWLQQQLVAISAECDFEGTAPRRYKLWVIDLSCVEFIDSSGLVALVTGLKVAAQANARLILCGLRPSAQLIFDITQLDRVFTIFDTYEAFALTLGMGEEMPCLEAV